MRRSLFILAWFALALLWGSEWMLAASLPAEPPLHFLSLRYAVASLLLLPFAVRGRFWRHPRRGLVYAAAIGAGLLGLPQILFVIAAHGISPAWSLLALAAVPIFLAVSGYGAIATAVCGFAGVLLLIAGSLTIHASHLPWLLLPVGAALAISAALARASAVREELRNMSLSSVLFVQCAVAAGMTGAAAAVLDHTLLDHTPLVWSGPVLAALLSSAGFATVAAYFLFYWLLWGLGPAQASMLEWVQVGVAVAESAVLTRSRPGWEVLAGVVLIGIALRQAFLPPVDDRGVMLQITR